MSIAVISSLYRVASHLEQFRRAVLTFAEQVHHAGADVHYLPILNDPTPTEHETIDTLSQKINERGWGRMTPHTVGRETLYASWNRGVRLTGAPYFTFWNADDVRDVNAFMEGYRALEAGATLVDFQFTGIKPFKRWGILPVVDYQQRTILFNPDRFTRKNGVGPFFMASRKLYDQVGDFDAHFQIAGDMDWAGRTLPHVQFYPAKQVGGYFHIHGDNLSNTGTNREAIEVNIIFMRRQDWHQLIPAEPDPMREAWESWGKLEDITVPVDVADFLWGKGARSRWEQYQAERHQPAWVQRIRRGLAARGLIHSTEWAVYQRNQSKSAGTASKANNA